MKKLMFVAAALAAGIAVADVTSANVVGYANKTWTAAKKQYFVCAQFKQIDKDISEMTLGALVPNSVWRTNYDSIKLINDGGRVQKTCIYVNEAWLPKAQEKNPDATIGWYDQADANYENNINTNKLPLGSCVLMYGSAKNVGFQSSGEVVAAEDGKITLVSTTAAKKQFVIGNCTPVKLTLGNFEVNSNWRTNYDNIKLLNDGGRVEKTCIYVNEAWLPKAQEKNPDATLGWYEDTDTGYENNLNSREVKSGEGFLLYASKAGISVTIPSAL